MAQVLSFDDLSVTFAKVLVTALSGALVPDAEVIVDTDTAEKVDAAGLQVLISGQRTASERGASLVVHVLENGPVARALDIYGLLSGGVANEPFLVVASKRA